MAFQDEEIVATFAGLPESAFGNVGREERLEWVKYVILKDSSVHV